MDFIEAVAAVKKFLIEGQSTADIQDFLQSESADKTDAIAAAWDQITEDADVAPDERRAWCIEAMRDIYRRFLESGDYPGALRAVEKIAQLSGVAQAASKKKRAKTDGENSEKLKIVWKSKKSNSRRK